jgi:hypothetical protein
MVATGLRAAWNAWKRLARRIGDIQARILLTLFYYVVLGPFALVLRWRSDPLALERGVSGGWRSRPESLEEPMAQARRQS